ncbi:MAG: tripartite tricarboxylate transporter substrate binding protein [Betaproteobacteria bacterium]|nr:tripartite tricarboxylate transporter substrate binding protein [Betaproteobacteria bacterium]
MKRIGPLVLALAALASAGESPAQQPYPSRPVRLVVGFAPGGAADTVARALSDGLSRALGQPVVIENRAGAGSSIAAENVAKSPADGYSILIASPSSISVNPALNPKLGYRPADLAPVTQVSASPLVLVVNPATDIHSVGELVAVAKKRPDFLNYATSGIGSAPHFGAALFGQLAGVRMVHVPFKGGAPAITSVVAGDTQLSFATPPSVMPMVKAGRLRALAVTSPERSSLMPEIPGMREAGLPALSLSFWYGIFVPAGTPPEVVRKLYEATAAAASRPEYKATLAREGTEVSLSRSPEEFAAFLAEDSKFWVKLAKDSGATAD